MRGKDRTKNRKVRGTDRAVQEKEQALSEKIEEIRPLLAEADSQDCLNRYQIAVQCREVRKEDGAGKRYGAKAMKKLAKALGWGKTTAYEYAAVADAWSQQKFEKLVEEGRRASRALSWSHFQALARLKEPKKRTQLAKKAMADGWSVHQLKRECRAKSKASAASEGPGSNVPRSLAVALTDYGTQMRNIKETVEVLSERVARRVKDVSPDDLDGSCLVALKTARQTLEELYDSNRNMLDSCIEEVMKMLELGNGRQEPESTWHPTPEDPATEVAPEVVASGTGSTE